MICDEHIDARMADCGASLDLEELSAAIAQKTGMAGDTVEKYAKAKNPPTKLYSVKERPKVEALTAPLAAED